MTSQPSSAKNVPVSGKRGTKPIQVIAAILFSIALPAVAESYGGKAQDALPHPQAIQNNDAAIGYDKQNLIYNHVAKAAEQRADNMKICANQSAIQ